MRALCMAGPLLPSHVLPRRLLRLWGVTLLMVVVAWAAGSALPCSCLGRSSGRRGREGMTCSPLTACSRQHQDVEHSHSTTPYPVCCGFHLPFTCPSVAGAEMRW